MKVCVCVVFCLVWALRVCRVDVSCEASIIFRQRFEVQTRGYDSCCQTSVMGQMFDSCELALRSYCEHVCSSSWSLSPMISVTVNFTSVNMWLKFRPPALDSSAIDWGLLSSSAGNQILCSHWHLPQLSSGPTVDINFSWRCWVKAECEVNVMWSGAAGLWSCCVCECSHCRNDSCWNFLPCLRQKEDLQCPETPTRIWTAEG